MVEENNSLYYYYYYILEKGLTSSDSYLYYAIAKNKPELACIIDKVIPLLDIDELSKVGYEEVPHIDNNKYDKKLIFIIVALGSLLIIVIVYLVKLINDLIKLVNDLIKERTEMELLPQIV